MNRFGQWCLVVLFWVAVFSPARGVGETKAATCAECYKDDRKDKKGKVEDEFYLSSDKTSDGKNTGKSFDKPTNGKGLNQSSSNVVPIDLLKKHDNKTNNHQSDGLIAKADKNFLNDQKGKALEKQDEQDIKNILSALNKNLKNTPGELHRKCEQIATPGARFYSAVCLKTTQECEVKVDNQEFKGQCILPPGASYDLDGATGPKNVEVTVEWTEPKNSKDSELRVKCKYLEPICHCYYEKPACEGSKVDPLVCNSPTPTPISTEGGNTNASTVENDISTMATPRYSTDINTENTELTANQ